MPTYGVTKTQCTLSVSYSLLYRTEMSQVFLTIFYNPTHQALIISLNVNSFHQLFFNRTYRATKHE